MNTCLQNALNQFNMQDKTATLLGHNENMTFNVADCFLLRIHKSADSFDGCFLYQNCDRKDLYKTELDLLTFLHSKGFAVQQPVCDKNGDYVAVLQDGSLATALSWIDGNVIDKNSLSPALCCDIGGMIADLHKATSDFCAKNILHYDADFCDLLKNKLTGVQKNGIFSGWQYNTLTTVCDKIKAVLVQKADSFVVVHGDLSFDNIIRTSDGLVPIDFSLCGCGHPMMDLSCMLSFFEDKESKSKVIAGYENSGGVVDTIALNACNALNELVGILLHIEKLATESWFENWLDSMCKNIFIPFIENKNIFETEINLCRIERVTGMEMLFDRLCGVVYCNNDDIAQIKNDITKLEKYYTDGRWKADFEADENGLLPRTLKRGVLSEDAVYNLLCEYDNIVRGEV